MGTRKDQDANPPPVPVWDPVWVAIFGEREWGKYPPEHGIRFIARHFYGAPDRRKVRLLDLGCGPGACTWYMAREGFDVAGVDGSATAITRARGRLAGEGLEADLRVGDFAVLPWPDAYFDGAVDNAALYATPLSNARKTVCEAYRVLKPGGLFLSAAFTDRTWGYGTGPQVEPGGFACVSEGPLADSGFQRFLGRPQIEELYTPFSTIGLETSSHTRENMSRTIELWIITCQKTTA